MNLCGKHVVVTGGGTGVGAAIATYLVELGAKVTIAGRRDAPLQALAEKHANMGWAVCDVTSQAEITSGFEMARSNFGAIDIVVANAGAAESKPFSKLTTDDMQTMLDVNLMGVFNTFQAALPDMVASGWGRMIVVASTAGLKGYGYVSAYAAAKHGVVGMTRSLAIEVAKKGITANAVCPSYVDTPMTERTIENIMSQTGRDHDAAVTALTAGNPQGRLITPLEVAHTVGFLCSDQAASINGQAIALSGGEV
jgi:NAD(P)-dependent dehydrogenase (short-subunit alcohol dehydrogenase family)